MLKIPFLFSLAQHPQRTLHRRLHTVKFFLGACLFLLVTGLITGHVSAQLQNGLAGYWSFDEGRGTTAGDSSGNGNTGTLIDGPTWVSGKSGTALSFDGADDYVEIPQAQSLNLSSALTVSAWINNQASTDSGLSQDQYRIIASKGWAPDGSGSWTLAWRVNDGSLLFFAGRFTSYRYVSFPYDNSQAGAWHLVTAVLENGTISLYQDGVLQAGPVGIDSNSLRTDTSPIRIGSSAISNNWLRNWNGSIDEFRIYNRALSADEIVSLYQQDNQSFNFSLANSMDLSATQGASATNTITANLLTGSPEPVSFSASGLPSGASASFSQKSCSPTCSSLLTISTATSAPTGTYTITVTGTGGGVTKTTSFALNVNSSASSTFNFSLSNDGNKSVTQGQSVTNTIAATLTSGSSQAVSFSTAGLPTGATASYTTSASCNPTCSRALNIATAASTPSGTYTITVTGTGGGITKTTSFSLAVTTSSTAPTPLSSGSATLLVKFGVTSALSTFGLSGWSTVIKDIYTDYQNIGPGGTTIVVGDNYAYNYQGVTGTATNFNSGDTIRVTWYNNSASSVTFTPNISFTDPDRITMGAAGIWYPMTSVTVPAFGSAASTHTLGSSSAGSYSLVNVNVNYTNTMVVIADKIELVPAGSSSSPSFDFALSNSGNKSVTQGQSVTNTITAALISGTSQAVSFSTSGLPSGATVSFSSASCSPTCSSTVTINTSGSTPTGSSTITVVATGGGLTKTTTFNLTVSSPTTTPTVGTPTITLAWQDNSDNEDDFAIERRTGTTGAYSQVASVAANATSYVDTNVNSGITYCYRVRAVNSAGASDFSNEACKTVP